MRIDLHTHSLVSDGTDTPTELVHKAAAAGLDVVGLTDHDTFDGLVEATLAGQHAGITVVPGVEMSTRLGSQSVHLLGYGCRVADPDLAAEFGRILAGRDSRVPEMVARLDALGLTVSLDEVNAQAQGTAVGRPHVADALVARGYVADRTDAFDRYLNDDGPAFVDRYAPDLVDGIRLVHDAGGVAVIAHPWSRGAAALLTEDVLVDLTRDHGLDGIEVDHPDHDHEVRAGLREIARHGGLIVTGSSDYHGTGKTRNPLGAEVTSPDTLAAIQAVVNSRAGLFPEVFPRGTRS